MLNNSLRLLIGEMTASGGLSVLFRRDANGGQHLIGEVFEPKPAIVAPSGRRNQAKDAAKVLFGQCATVRYGCCLHDVGMMFG